jgi:ATP-binding cassette subfamily F protein 3
VLLRGECAAIIGPNGAGKTTFLKTILEKTPPFTGKVQLGASLKVGYFAQAHEGLDPQKTLMDEIDSIAPNMLPAEIRHYLAKYLFTGDDVFRKVDTLSGGERGRLALAKLSLTDANLLLLDEPTNHLDLPTQEVLESVLSNFPGTILLVSHDRYLIDSLASQIWEVDPDGKTLQVFKGSYTQYKTYLQRLAESRMLQEKQLKDKPKEKSKAIRVTPNSLSKYHRRKMQDRVAAIEEEIQILEAQQTIISTKLEAPPTDSDEVLKLGEHYVALQNKVEFLLDEWSDLTDKLAES